MAGEVFRPVFNRFVKDCPGSAMARVERAPDSKLLDEWVDNRKGFNSLLNRYGIQKGSQLNFFPISCFN